MSDSPNANFIRRGRKSHLRKKGKLQGDKSKEEGASGLDTKKVMKVNQATWED